jgi:hypothetical protein
LAAAAAGACADGLDGGANGAHPSAAMKPAIAVKRRRRIGPPMNVYLR